MKTIILAGGFGTRLAEYTNLIPKPMVEIGGKPILWHIMNIYSSYGYNDFVIALGYKGEVIKDYFLNYYALNNDFEVDLSNGTIKYVNEKKKNWKVTLVHTGTDSMTGGRVKRLQKYIGNKPFMLTYGDGLSDVNMDDLLKFHRGHDKSVTLTAVRPNARFGELQFDNNTITGFDEKPQLAQGWINGGFFVMDPGALNYMQADLEMLEREPMNRIVKDNQLAGYKHTGFWQCMDTKRDHERLEKLYNENPIWLN